MRTRKRENGLVAHAIAGTHVVYLGWDVPNLTARKGLLGFALWKRRAYSCEAIAPRLKKMLCALPQLASVDTEMVSDLPGLSLPGVPYIGEIL